MNAPVAHVSLLWQLIIFGGAVVFIVFALVLISSFLGQRHRERATGEPYESGIAPTGTARVRFNVKYYLVAMVFLIFDIEAVFLYTWAVSVRETGWMGFWEAVVFIVILLAALAYIWRTGALEWGSAKKTQ